MRDYYTGGLSGERLRQCYDLGSPRVKQYLEAEIRFVVDRLQPEEVVLELGCGYGRVASRIAEVAKHVVGIDTAIESVALARRMTGVAPRCEFAQMDALTLAFEDSVFDRVVCVQNGICAFGVDQERLAREALRVTRRGGMVIFSTYAQRFWTHRLAWFEAQAARGLVGAIDRERTGNGVIACEDGFRAGMVPPEVFCSLGERLGLNPEITEVDESSVFCEMRASTVVAASAQHAV